MRNLKRESIIKAFDIVDNAAMTFRKDKGIERVVIPCSSAMIPFVENYASFVYPNLKIEAALI